MSEQKNELKIVGTIEVKQVREGKDKVSGAPSGVYYIKGSFDGGLIDFQLKKSSFGEVKFGDRFNVVFDAFPQMVRLDFGENTQWKNGFVVGEILQCERLKNK